MKKVIGSIFALIGVIMVSSCGNNNNIEGTYVREVPTQKKDSIFITHLKDNIFHFEAHEWHNGQKKSKSSTATVNGNEISFDNNKSVTLNDDKEIIVGKTTYIKID